MKAISRAVGRFLECLANRTNGFDLKDRCVGYDKLEDASAGSFVEIYGRELFVYPLQSDYNVRMTVARIKYETSAKLVKLFENSVWNFVSPDIAGC